MSFESTDELSRSERQEAEPELQGAIDAINRTFGHVQSDEELEGIQLDEEADLSIRETLDLLLSSLKNRLERAGSLLSRIESPIVRHLMITDLMSRFSADELRAARPDLEKLMREDGFSMAEIADACFRPEDRPAQTTAPVVPEFGAQTDDNGRSHQPPDPLFDQWMAQWRAEDALAREIERRPIFLRKELAKLRSYRDVLSSIDEHSEEAPDRQELQRHLDQAERDFRSAIKNNLFLAVSIIERLKGSDLEKSLTGLAQEKFCSIFGLLEGDLVSIGLLERLAEAHFSFMEQANKQFNEQELPPLLARFKERAQRLVDAGTIPFGMEEIERRLAGIEVLLLDSSHKKAGGDYDAEYRQVRLFSVSALPQGEGRLEHTFTHELFHAISGQGTPENGLRRVGMGSGDLTTSWLNEAITKNLKMEVLGQEHSHAYRIEREELERLFAQGLPKELLYRAYFEHGQAEDLARTGSWHELAEVGKRLLLEGGAEWMQTIGERLIRSE